MYIKAKSIRSVGDNVKLWHKLLLKALALAIVTFFTTLMGSAMVGGQLDQHTVIACVVVAVINMGVVFGVNFVVAVNAIRPDDDANMDDKPDSAARGTKPKSDKPEGGGGGSSGTGKALLLGFI